MKPDTVVWTVHITSTDPNLQSARSDSDQRTHQVLELRDDLDIDAADVQTDHLSIQKVFHRDRDGNQGAFRHYSVQRTVVLRQRRTDKFDDVLQQLTAIDNVEISYRLESSDFHHVRRETRLRAVSAAKQKADDMTSLLGAELGHVLAIDETSPDGDTWRGSPISNAAFYAGPPAQPDDVSGTFAPGSIESRVSVNVAFAIE